MPAPFPTSTRPGRPTLLILLLSTVMLLRMLILLTLVVLLIMIPRWLIPLRRMLRVVRVPRTMSIPRTRVLLLLLLLHMLTIRMRKRLLLRLPRRNHTRVRLQRHYATRTRLHPASAISPSIPIPVPGIGIKLGSARTDRARPMVWVAIPTVTLHLLSTLWRRVVVRVHRIPRFAVRAVPCMSIPDTRTPSTDHGCRGKVVGIVRMNRVEKGIVEQEGRGEFEYRLYDTTFLPMSDGRRFCALGYVDTRVLGSSFVPVPGLSMKGLAIPPVPLIISSIPSEIFRHGLTPM